MKNLSRIALGVFSLYLFAACTDARLGLLPGEFVNVQSEGSFCTLSPEAVNRHTKFLFIVDKSGSNGQTDPGAQKRADNIDLFYQDNKDNDA
ncbi:MAG: hypothetical protein KDD25_06110, partial [Bdellovibrionales bacterium]|nr:hypothetical protein [Bdellovibrionales bacterium]